MDDFLLPFNVFAEKLADLPGFVADESDIQQLRLREVEMELPVLLDISTEDGDDLELGAAPPIYYLDTGFNPVFHQISVRVSIEDKEDTLDLLRMINQIENAKRE